MMHPELIVKVIFSVCEIYSTIEVTITIFEDQYVPTGPLTKIKDTASQELFVKNDRFHDQKTTFMEDLQCMQDISEPVNEKLVLALLLVLAPALWSYAQDHPSFKAKLCQGMITVSFVGLEDVKLVLKGQLPPIRFVDPKLLPQDGDFAKWHKSLDHNQGFTIKVALMTEDTSLHKTMDVPFNYRYMFDPKMDYFKTVTFKNPVQEDEKCDVCSEPASSKCGKCLWAVYCSRDCLLRDYKNHRVKCKRIHYMLKRKEPAEPTIQFMLKSKKEE